MKKLIVLSVLSSVLFLASCASNSITQGLETEPAKFTKANIVMVIDHVSPEDNAVNVPTVSDVKIFFRQPIKTCSRTIFILKDSNDQLVPCNVKSKPNTLCLAPFEGLKKNMEYTAVISNVISNDSTKIFIGAKLLTFKTHS